MIQNLNITEIKPYEKNPRKNEKAIDKVAQSIKEFGFKQPIVIDNNNIIIAGHTRYQASIKLGLENVPVIIADDLSDEQVKAYRIADNRVAQEAEWDLDLLKMELVDLKEIDYNLLETGFDEMELEELLKVDKEINNPYGEMGSLSGSLSKSFGIPPFTVLNAREGWWQERKKSWVDLGIKSELGRANNLLGEGLETVAKALGTEGGALETSTSVFDPVLAELAYKWFSPPQSTILDPFAGGSVRGIVATKCGRKYFGCDLREEQVKANEIQANAIIPKTPPIWKVGDSLKIAETFEGLKADMLFTCPPYFDMEQYSDNPNDLSNMSYEDFKKNYTKIIEQSCSLLRNDSFAVIVVGEIRDKKGNYHNFVGDTVRAFTEAGLHYYNEAILVTSVGSLPLRSRRAFEVSRKLGKTHQNVLVFVKGDARTATDACGKCEFGDFDVGESIGEVMK